MDIICFTSNSPTCLQNQTPPSCCFLCSSFYLALLVHFSDQFGLNWWFDAVIAGRKAWASGCKGGNRIWQVQHLITNDTGWFGCFMEDVWTRLPSSLKVNFFFLLFVCVFLANVAPCCPSGVRNYLKEALVNIITVHAEVKIFQIHPFDFFYPNRAFSGRFCPPLRSSRSLRTWSLGSCPRLSSQSQTRCAVLCSVCLPSARTEPCRYLQWNAHKQSSLALLLRPWLIIIPSHSSGGFSVVLSQLPTVKDSGYFISICSLLPLSCTPHPLQPTVSPPCPPQARLELCALRDAIAAYLNTESK